METLETWANYLHFDDYVRATARVYGDATCIREFRTGRSLNYLELEELSRRAASLLWKRGLRKGDRFAVWTKNRLEFFILYLAALRSGALIVPLVDGLPLAEVGNLLERFSVQILFAAGESLQELKGVSSACALEDLDLLILSLLNDTSLNDSSLSDYHKSQMSEPGSLYQSSGTTGEPKGIPQSAANLLSAGEALVKVYELGNRPTYLGVLPCYHTALATYGFWPCFIAGGEFVLVEKFSRSGFWQALHESKAKFVEVVPTILTLLLRSESDSASLRSREALNHLSFIGCGSAPLSPELHEEFERVFHVKVANQYGLSETAPTHFNSPFVSERKFGSIGQAMSSCEAKVIDTQGNEVAPGVEGEIVIQGPSVFLGYWKSLENKSFCSLGFKTGDLGYRDQQGWYYLTGRSKEMINRGGAKIYPTEVDRVLLKFRGESGLVLDAASFSIPDSLYGEEVVASVVAEDSSPLLINEIIEHCQRHLPLWKCPKQIFRVPEIPRTPSGKILRRKLSESYSQTTHQFI